MHSSQTGWGKKDDIIKKGKSARPAFPLESEIKWFLPGVPYDYECGTKLTCN